MNITMREKRESARDYALRQIRENIITLKLKPGSTISENELAKELGISRTPVREALQELGKSNLVETYPQKGTVVSPIDFDIVEEMVFLRRVLEKAVVEELCDCISEENIKILKKNVELQNIYLKNMFPEKIMELDNEFHRSLFAMCNKNRIYKIMESTQGHFDRIRTLSIYSVKEIKTVEEHEKLLKAIIAGDKEDAAKIMTEHLSRYKLEQKEIMEKYPDYF